MFTSFDRITLSGKSFHRSTTLAVKLFLHNSNIFLRLYNFIEFFLPGLSLNCKKFNGYTFDLSFKILYTWIISALWCLSSRVVRFSISSLCSVFFPTVLYLSLGTASRRVYNSQILVLLVSYTKSTSHPESY